jgi:peptide/nickel transport system ATP-binding protein
MATSVSPHLARAAAPAPDAPLLRVTELSVDARRPDGAVRLVDDISFELARGQTLGLVGESGSGKTVTAMSIIRLLPPALRVAAGTIEFDGRDVAAMSEPQLRTLRGDDIGVVFQDPQNSFNPAYTVGNQMVEAIRAHTNLSSKAALARAVSLLDRVGIPRAAKRVKDYPHQLSGGMAQRAMIATAIACQPKLLIADEPTTALDVTVQAQILALLRSLQDELDMSLLIISHDLSVIAEMADDVAVFYAGQVVERGDVVTTLTAPQHPYTEALLAAQPGATTKGQVLVSIPGIVPNADAMPAGCRFHPRCRYATDVCAAREPALEAGVRCLRHAELTLTGVGGVADAAARPEAPTGDPASGDILVDVRDLRKEFTLRSGRWGRKTTFAAVDDVSFTIDQAETVGLVGESGAGKSTVGRLILGLAAATAGTVRFDGADVGTARRSERRAIRRDVQAVFQNPYASLDPMMTIGDTLAEPLDVHASLSKSETRARVAELLGQVGLDAGAAERYPHELSGGQRQRVAIARALALNPKLIVCDEPVSSLDVSTQAQVLNLLVDLQRRFGIAYLFVGHDLSVVYQISDRVAVMYRGRVVEMGPSEAVYTTPRHPYTQALLAAVLSVDPRTRRLEARPDAADVGAEPTAVGCPYADRCPQVMDRCRTDDPPPTEVAPGVTVRCHLYDPAP